MQVTVKKENYLLEPLGKSTTKEDHERIHISERERSKKERKPRTVTMSQKVTIKR